ncbi:uncharacterized protein [Typha angustifolia]|uniref:uncharacterized protein n=1 Tax=Typha angustifolia TaxID=59011 RepID=UPI003C309CF7
MGKKSKDPNPIPELCNAVKSLFAADNPFRRKPSPEPPGVPPELGLRLPPKEEPQNPFSGGAAVPAKERKRRWEKERSPSPSPDPDSIPHKRKKLENDGDGSPKKKRRKRKRDEIEQEYERRKYGAAAGKDLEGNDDERGGVVVGVGQKRKASDAAAEMVVSKEESYDDESKLARTVFVGNLPLKTKHKTLLKEFATFGEIESVRVRSVPLKNTKTPRKGAIFQGEINDAVDSVHAYIVFKDEQSAHAALSHNMAQVGGHHMRVDMACPPRKKLKGEGPLYDRKRTVFVGNLPFDVKDEELYELFCGASGAESNVEAIRVVRDPNMSLGKGIAYVLFKTREAANTIIRKRDLMIRDRVLRLSHAKPSDAVTPTKRKSAGSNRDFPEKKRALTSGNGSSRENDKFKLKAASLSYQGLKSSKTGVLKKARKRPQSSNNGNKDGNHERENVRTPNQKVRNSKRPKVAARKAKQLSMKRKQDNATPENTHRHKRPRKQ